jgi:hypothetical protein
MAQCNLCKKYVHAECDSSLDITQRDALADCTCPVCKNRDSTEVEIDHNHSIFFLNVSFAAIGFSQPDRKSFSARH